MERAELINHLEHLAEYVKYSEDAPALREVIEMLKCSEMPNSSKDFFWKNARKNARKYTETHACDLIKRETARRIIESPRSKEQMLRMLEATPPAQPDHIAEAGKKVDADLISMADVEQTVEDNILCYTHSDRPIDQDPDTECHKAIRTALKMLRKDLRKLPSAQPEVRTQTSSADCISRREAIDALTEYGSGNDIYMSVRELKRRIEALPSAQPEIIRCKDCKHYYYADNRIPQEQRYSCDLDGDRWTSDSFCSFAERGEE